MELPSFPKGMNNKVADHELPEGTVRNLVNVDVSSMGKGRRRKGMTKVYNAVNSRAGYNCPAGEFFVEGSALKRLNADFTATTLIEGVFGEHCTFEYVNGTVYFSDSLIARKILSDDTVTKWGMNNPDSFILTPASGSLAAGRYTAAITFVDNKGVESGASDIAELTLAAAGGVRFMSLPTSSDPQVAGLRLYLSMPNGSTFFYIGQVALGTTTYTISAGAYDDSRVLETLLVTMPPPGRIIRYYKGRLYIVDASGTCWYTDEFALDHIKPADNYLQFPNPQVIMEPTSDGIYFADDYRTDFYLGADPKDFTVIPVFEYGGVLGTGRRDPGNAKIVTWFSKRGQVIAGPGGEARNIQEEHVATEIATAGASLIREQDGIKQFIAILENPTTSRLAARSFIEAEIIRKGA